MKTVTHSFIEFIGWMFGAGFVMAYARWLISNEEHKFRLIAGQAIINAFTGSTALIVIAVKPAISDYALYGIAFTILVIGPAAFKLIIMKVIEKKID